MARQATSTYNIDVHSIVRRYNRILEEIARSQSSGVSFTNPFDVNRIASYVIAMRNFQNFVVAQPLLDCPETGPTEIALPENPRMPVLENESMMDVINLVEIARDEVANSQSARMPTNLLKFDKDRQDSYLAKIEQLMMYIASSEPLDLPESSPMQDVTGSGRQGV